MPRIGFSNTFLLVKFCDAKHEEDGMGKKNVLPCAMKCNVSSDRTQSCTTTNLFSVFTLLQLKLSSVFLLAQ
jgi:hypothetical protein